jgi:NAD(P)-dependent dehydrogenase (short-subunit alcohol dehydrogenase family)
MRNLDGTLDGTVAIVTGAGRGIGRGEALELARQGARVVVNELDADAGADVVVEIEQLGGEAVLDTGDVTDLDAARGMLQRAIDRWGALDAVVNNAGVVRDRTIANMTPEEWDSVIRVHLRGHYAPTHLACAYWKSRWNSGRRPGHIVCTSSTSGLLGNFGQANYGTAKAGIAAFTQIVAQEMAKYAVTCNAIAPAARTRMTEGAYGTIDGPSASNEFDFWHPDNVAPLVAYLCSDASAHISGKVFGIQGDAVELYQPWTSVAAIENDDQRWTVSGLADRVGELFAASGMEPGPENGMARLRYSMTTRAAL